MNKDIRVAISFFNHRKTRRLHAKYGDAGVLGLLKIWAYAAESRSSGYLIGMSDEDIALEANHSGNAAEFVAFLIDPCKWIDKTENGLYLHDWHIHNPWAAKAEDRSDKARFSRMALTHTNIYNDLKAKGVDAISRETYDTLTSCQRTVGVALSPAPAPAPAPAPSPAPESKPEDKAVRKKREPFTIPTLEEVTVFCLERKNNVNPQKFIDHYTNTGWRIGKPPGYPMKDWKAAVRNTWEGNNLGGGYGSGNTGRTEKSGVKTGSDTPAAGKYLGIGEAIDQGKP